MIPAKKYETFWKRLFASLIDGGIFNLFDLLLFTNNTVHNKSIYVLNSFLYIIIWTTYLVYFEGKYGQTIGKMAAGIKILDINEKKVIGFKRAFIRECIPFFFSIAGVFYLLFLGKPNTNGEWNSYDNYISIAFFLWLIAELVSMFSNEKRRAIHDLMAGSVVVQLSELEREKIRQEREKLFPLA